MRQYETFLLLRARELDVITSSELTEIVFLGFVDEEC